MRCKVDAGIRCLIRFRAPIPEAIFLVNFSMWLCQLSLSSIITPSDFVAVTWLTWVLVILIVGEAVRVFSLCLDPISMNSVLVMFNVSLFACSQTVKIIYRLPKDVCVKNSGYLPISFTIFESSIFWLRRPTGSKGKNETINTLTPTRCVQHITHELNHITWSKLGVHLVTCLSEHEWQPHSHTDVTSSDVGQGTRKLISLSGLGVLLHLAATHLSGILRSKGDAHSTENSPCFTCQNHVFRKLRRSTIVTEKNREKTKASVGQNGGKFKCFLRVRSIHRIPE